MRCRIIWSTIWNLDGISAMSNFRRSGSGIAGKVLEHACRIISGCDSGEITLDDALDTLPEDCRRIVEHLLFNFYRQRKVVRRELNKFIQRPPSPKVMTLLTGEGRDIKINVKIGTDGYEEIPEDCSLVTATYSANGTKIGTYGVIGPIRMDYQKVVAVLENVGKILESILTNR